MRSILDFSNLWLFGCGSMQELDNPTPYYAFGEVTVVALFQAAFSCLAYQLAAIYFVVCNPQSILKKSQRHNDFDRVLIIKRRRNVLFIILVVSNSR